MINSHNNKLKRALVWAPSKLYELAVRLRVVAYETAYLQPKRLDATVISVGNLTLGGAGKTPMVQYIARYLKSEDHRVAILTRGYARKSSGMRVLNDRANRGEGGQASSYFEFGDEPVMLARAMPEIPIIVNKDRYEAGRRAEQSFGSDVLVLDDGYQHLSLARDLNILLIDATDTFGGFEMPPFGRLREPLYGLKRADVVIVTRADRAFDEAQTRAIIKHYCGESVPVMFFYSGITALRHLATGEAYEINNFAGWNVAVACAIGNTQAFSDDLLQVGINIVSEKFFRDHHPFTQAELDEITRSAKETGADAILTTEKDAVRLEGLKHGDIPVYAAQLELQSDDEVRLKSLLLRTVSKGKSKK
ncbi:MAG TPA: tetraacyldisaccharide 4'-kinase [Blastocatellia bacterium]|nr:tetraacyldisaccharide 4'-kinase [Blastocatellia bacterium]